jgi:hypothetical protein
MILVDHPPTTIPTNDFRAPPNPLGRTEFGHSFCPFAHYSKRKQGCQWMFIEDNTARHNVAIIFLCVTVLTSMFGQFSREHKTNGGLNFSAGKRCFFIIRGQFAGFRGDAFKNVVDKRVHDTHPLFRNSRIRVDLYVRKRKRIGEWNVIQSTTAYRRCHYHRESAAFSQSYLLQDLVYIRAVGLNAFLGFLSSSCSFLGWGGLFGGLFGRCLGHGGTK